jgi:drug/metabolite transporter (DMT)-like permease
MISKEQRGSLYAITSGFLYGFVGYFGVSVVQSSISVTNMLFWRFFISSIVIGVVTFWQIKQTKSSRKDIFIAFGNGAIFYGLSTMLYFFACPFIGSGLSMVIFFTYPAMVMLLNYFFYEQKIPSLYYYAIVIIIAGMSLFIDTNKMKFDLIGIALSTLSALLYAAYIISSKKIATLPPNLSTLMVCLGCMVTCLIFSLVNHSFVIPTTLPVWLNLLGISILSTTVPILLFLYSLNYISSEKASILSVLEPIFVLIFGVTLLGEPMQRAYLFGVIIVLTGALITLFSERININSLKKNS